MKMNKNFEEMYKETYNNTLKFIVINCYDINSINDIIQDTYVELYKIMKKRKKINTDNIEAFICGIAKNIIKRHYSKNKRNSIIQNIEIIEDIENVCLEDDFINKENINKIWEYIKNKDFEISQIFYLYFVLDEKIADISKELNLSESNVKNKLYRTIKELKNKFGKEEYYE